MKTKVHELLGVELGERFKCKRHSKTFYMGSCGVLWEEYQNGVRISSAAMLASLINDPSLIIHAYTPEQVKIMRALVELGFTWIAKDIDADWWAFTDKPKICDERYWRVSQANSMMHISVLASRFGRIIPDWRTPLDLLAALGDAEPVTDSNHPSNYVGEAAVEYGAPFDGPLDQERRGMLGGEV